MHASFRIRYALVASTLLFLLTASCTASSRTNPDYKFSEGEILRHTFQTSQKGSVTIDGEQDDFDLQMANTVRQKVQKVDGQGIATIQSSFEKTTLTIDGEELPAPEFDDAEIVFELTGDGSIQNVRGTHGLAGPLGERQLDPGQIFQLQGPTFREGAVKKGDTWQHSITIPMPGGYEVQAIVDYTYAGKERIDGKEAAKVDFSFDTPLELVNTDSGMLVTLVGRESMQGTAYFGLKDGKTIKANGIGPLELSLRMPSEGGGDELERIKVEIMVEFAYEAQE